MNKKVFVLLSLPFVLASCHGQAISRELARDVLANIEKANEEEIPFSVYTLKISIDEDKDKSEQMHFYSITDKYYHSYSTVNGAVSEEWCYVKADSEGVDYIYNVIRIIDSSINEETAPRYAMQESPVEYTEENWEEKHNRYSRILLNQTSSIISSLKAYLESEPDESSLVLESYGAKSLYAKRTMVDSSNKVTYEKEVEFSDNNLANYSFKTTGNQAKNRSYSVSYSSVEIFYPKID